MAKNFRTEMQSLGYQVKAEAPKQIIVSDLTEDDPAEAIADKINTAKVTASASTEDPTPKPSTVDIESLIKESVKAAVAGLREESDQQIEAIKNEAERRIREILGELETERAAAQAAENSRLESEAKVKRELEIERAASQRLAEALKLQGSQETNKVEFPNVNTTTTTDSDKPVGCMAEIVGIIEASLIEKATPAGEITRAFNYAELDTYIRANRKQVVKDLETSFKNNGMLRGPDPTQVKAAATTMSDLPGAFLEVLSSLVRQTHRGNLIHWQFCPTEMNFAKGAGTYVDVYRSAYLPTTDDPDDFLVGDGSSYQDLISDDGQTIQTGIIQAQLKEYALGKVGTDMKPITIPTFVMAYSMINLLQIVNRNLGRNYFEHEDLQIRSLWKPTSRVLYNNAGNITTDPLDLDTNSDGTFVRRFCSALFEYAHTLQLMPWPDGCYGVTLPPKAARQLKDSFEDKWEANTKVDMVELMNNFLQQEYPGETDPRITGYLGKYEGLHFFNHNTYGLGIAGTEGVQNVTTGDGAKLTRSSYLFGMDSIGRGVGDPMRIVQNEVTNYGRKNNFVWMETAAYVAKDVDPTGYSDTSDVRQQLRVIEIRTLDTPL